MAKSYITKGAVGYKRMQAGTIFIVVGIILMKLEILVLISLACFITGIILILIAVKQNRKSVRNITEDVVRPFLEKNFQNAVYDPFCDETDTAIYTDVRVIKKDSTMNYADYLSLTIDGYYFECLHCEASHRNNKSQVTSFDGNIYSCMGDRNIEGTVRIIPTRQGSIIKSNEYHNYARCAGNEVRIETGDESFDCCFEVYASDMHVGHYVMNAYVKEKLVDLRDEYDEYCIVVTGRDIYMAHNTPTLPMLANVSDVTIDEDTKVKNIENAIHKILDEMLELQRTMSLHAEV